MGGVIELCYNNTTHYMQTDVCDVCESCFLCFGGMIIFKSSSSKFVNTLLGLDNFINCLLFMQQYRLLL